MTCDQTREKLGSYLYSEVGAQERRQLEAHMETCASCRRELETEQRFVNALVRRMREISEDVTR
jgi:anti-sigma factor RsiW